MLLTLTWTRSLGFLGFSSCLRISEHFHNVEDHLIPNRIACATDKVLSKTINVAAMIVRANSVDMVSLFIMAVWGPFHSWIFKCSHASLSIQYYINLSWVWSLTFLITIRAFISIWNWLLLLGCLCPWPFRLNHGFRLWENKFLWFCNFSSSGMFMPLGLYHKISDWTCHHRTPLCFPCILHYDIRQGSSRLCNWLSLWCMVPWINHLPPIC